MTLPKPPDTGRPGLDTVPSGPSLWRIWHPSRYASSADQPRTYGPLSRFDPHPPGSPGEHPDHVAWYGAAGFDVSALEVFNRGGTVAEVCPRWRGSLVAVHASTMLFPLDDASACAQVGATTRLGADDVATYRVTQRWGRFFHASPGVDGVRYLACRAADRSGVATGLLREGLLGDIDSQHRLIDDALWPQFMTTLDAVGMASVQIDRQACGRCRN